MNDRVEELKKLQAAGASQGAANTNYHEWSDILKELGQVGVESTGNVQSDKALLKQLKEFAAEEMAKMQEQKATEQKKSNTEQPQKMVNTDSEQRVKANVTNGVSQEAMANYLKYFHTL